MHRYQGGEQKWVGNCVFNTHAHLWVCKRAKMTHYMKCVKQQGRASVNVCV